MIYVHIPFCKKACHYCDFHFSTSMGMADQVVDSICQEIEQRKDYLQDKNIKSVYFGGGTPSILTQKQLARIFETIHKHFSLTENAEITLEANPDDLSKEKLAILSDLPINRLSIGVQSFYQEDLLWMNRAHNAHEAEASIKLSQDFGFHNLSCDLIYGYPLLTDRKWHENLEKLVSFGIPHISSYAMTVEEKTALHHQILKGKSTPMDEIQSAEQMDFLMTFAKKNGYEQYEISNFATGGHYAVHNTNYWKGIHYLGVGPSAHSFNGVTRSWNVSNNSRYVKSVFENNRSFESEILTLEDHINEYLMTSLRTMWGIDLSKIEMDFGTPYKNHILGEVERYVASRDVVTTENKLKLTDSGRKKADRIASDLFIVTE